MGSTPDIVNYKGEVLTQDMKDALQGFHQGGRQFKVSDLDPDARERFDTWLHGIAPKAVDPTDVWARANAVGGAKEKAAAGMGLGGLFGFGKSMGDLSPLTPLGSGPMAPGVPYSVPPLPKIKPIFDAGKK